MWLKYTLLMAFDGGQRVEFLTDSPGKLSAKVRREAYRSLTEHAARGEISIDVIQLPLAEVASAWEQQRQGAPAKLVLVP